MNQLPLEIIHHILKYDGRIKYRHGKYMNQIAQDDDRYQMLQGIPQFHSYFSSEWSSSYIHIILQENYIYYTKKINSSYTGEIPRIDIRIGIISSYYNYTKDGISYIWTIYYKELK
jgi:hypothetical protein